MEQGLIDAKLSDYVYKKRIALEGRGKRGGARTILAFKLDDKAFYIFGFAKNTLENIDQQELSRLRILASVLIKYSDAELQKAIKEKELIEVNYE